jgi:8-oxo-dGTP pyrophosphatase MutT (NUDIX family)
MHRRTLLELLEKFAVSPLCTSSETAAHARILDFVTRQPACFERATPEGHITGSAWILDHARAACLLTHHKKLNLWLQPGGHADGDSDVQAVAHREAREESGIPDLTLLSPEIFDVDVHVIPARKQDPEHLHFDIRFAFVALEGAQYVVSDESHALAWVKRDEVSTYNTDDSVLRLADKWQP